MYEAFDGPMRWRLATKGCLGWLRRKMRFLAAIFAGLTYLCLTPIFMLIASYWVSTLFFVHLGHTFDVAQGLGSRFMGRTIHAIGLTETIFMIGLGITAALSAGIATARVNRPSPYLAVTIVVSLSYAAIFWFGLEVPLPADNIMYRILAGGTACLYIGAAIGMNTWWPDVRPTLPGHNVAQHSELD